MATESGDASPNMLDCSINGCGEGYACNDQGQCVSLEPDSLTLALRVVPPLGSTAWEHHITGIQLTEEDGNANVVLNTITLATNTLVTGHVYFSDDGRTPAVARVTFELQGGIGNALLARSVDTNSAGDFSIEVPPGLYNLTVNPLELAVPVSRVQNLTVTAESAALDLPLPVPEANFVVRGQLVRQAPDELEPVAIGAARVELVSVDTQQVSTPGETDAEGRFSLLVPPIEAAYELRVGPSQMNALVPELTLEIPPISPTSSPCAEPSDTCVELGELIAGSWGDPLDVSGQVLGANGEPQPLVGANIYFRQELELGVFTQVAQSDETGAYISSIIPGIYEVTPVPPTNIDYGADTFNEQLDEANRDAGFTLLHKPSLEGSVFGPNGVPVEGVIVTAEPTGFSVRSLSLGAVTSQTGTDGSFEMAVHPGAQRLVFQPPGDLDVAPLVADAIRVDQSSAIIVSLQQARTIGATVVHSDGTPVEGATIEAYLYLDGDVVLLVGTAFTDVDGFFAVRLPTVGL